MAAAAADIVLIAVLHLLQLIDFLVVVLHFDIDALSVFVLSHDRAGDLGLWRRSWLAGEVLVRKLRRGASDVGPTAADAATVSGD